MWIDGLDLWPVIDEFKNVSNPYLLIQAKCLYSEELRVLKIMAEAMKEEGDDENDLAVVLENVQVREMALAKVE